MPKLETLYDLFPEQNRRAIDSLIEDEDFQKQLPSLILDRIQKRKREVLPIEEDIIPLLFSQANFARLEESYYIASLFSRYLSFGGNFLPLASNFLEDIENLKRKGKLNKRDYIKLNENFASRCLFSLSFFYEALRELYLRRGAPRPEFYREMGKRTFVNIGEERIADHFEEWEEFIREDAFS